MIQPVRRTKTPSKFPIRLAPRSKPLPGTSSEPTLTRFAGIGPFHSLLIPGLVPDGLETFHRIRKHFQGKGEVSVLTYPYAGFGLDALFATIEQFLSDCSRRKRRPVLVGVSVGGGFVLEFLRRQKLAGKDPDLAGLVLVSPMVSAQDLAPILRRLWLPIVADEPTADQALEKGRSFFRQLASKSAHAKRGVPAGWKGFFAAFTPQGLNDLLEAPLRRRIDRTLNAIPAQGAILRCRLLKELHGLEKGGPASVLTSKPTLILWGSKERHTLDVDGPGVGTLCRPDLAEKHFPDCQVQWIYAGGEPVPHASLLKHDKAFARPIKEFLARL
jgi:pimeloyl-ACP methyl ester carboxylesterase